MRPSPRLGAAFMRPGELETATTSVYHLRPDPWRRRHAWRHSGINSWKNRRAHILPGFGISAVLFSGFIAWDQLTQPHRIESLRTAQQETQARKAHIRELMEEYKLIGKKKED